MNVFHFNAIFTRFFVVWCIVAIFLIPTIPKTILGPCTRWVQAFYLIVAFLVYRNVWAYEYEKYVKKCLTIAITGFALVSIVQILACFHYASLLGFNRWDPERNGEDALILLIPSLPLGLFGFAISFYCNLKISVPFDSYKRVEYYSLFSIYATLALSLSSYILYFVALNEGTVFRHDAITTHSAIILGSILILAGFISLRKEPFLAAFLALAFAAFTYIKIAGKMSYFWMQETDTNNLKADYNFVMFHIFTILIFIFTGMIMCYYVKERPHVQEKPITKHKIFVLSKETLPFCQKC